MSCRIRERHGSIYGHGAKTKTFSTISHPVGICHANRPTLRTLRAMWAFRAFEFPLVMDGTRDAARAHSTTIPERKHAGHNATGFSASARHASRAARTRKSIVVDAMYLTME